MSAFLHKICCGLAGMDGWKHAVRADGSHLWFWKTKAHALGVIVWPDVAGAPLFAWKVKRLRDGLEVEGGCLGVPHGTQLAVDTHTRWLERDAEYSKPRREPRWLPAADEPTPF